jgi:ABC-2 type transport system ATP-binding protein
MEASGSTRHKDADGALRAGVPPAELRAVTHRYGTVTALDGVSLALRPGELLALLGPNGAGKTTAVKLLLGLLRPAEGTVRVFGADPVEPATRRRVGAMLQVAKVPETLRVREHLELFASYYPRPLPLAEAVEAAGLRGYENRLFGQLSGGERQRVLFALALVGDPDLLFLDEPTVGLDVESRRGFWAHIRAFVARGRTVLLTTHHLEEADALADRVVVLHKGHVIADGSPVEVKSVASEKRVRCVTRLSVDELRTLPGVLGGEEDRAAIVLRTREAEAVVRQLLLRDPGLRDLEVSSVALEDAFLQLTAH